MKNRTILKMLMLLGSLVASQAYALGLGNITLNSHLNEPLSARIQLVSTGEVSPNEVLVNLAPQEDFDKAMVDRSYELNSLVFQLDVSDSKNPALIVTTPSPIREPSLDFIVELRSPSGRVLREYTLLLDIAQGGTARQPARRSTVVVKRAHPVATKPKTAPVASAPSVVPPAPAPSAADAAAEAAAKAALAAQLASAQEQANHAVAENETLKKQLADLEKQLADATAQLNNQSVQLQAMKAQLEAANAAKQAATPAAAPTPAPQAAVAPPQPAPAAAAQPTPTPPPVAQPVVATPQTPPPVAQQPVAKPQTPSSVAPVEPPAQQESGSGLGTVLVAVVIVLLIAGGLWMVRKRQQQSAATSPQPEASTVTQDADTEMDAVLAQYGAEHPLAAQQEEATPPVEEKPLTTDEALDRLLADTDFGSSDVPTVEEVSSDSQELVMDDEFLPSDELMPVAELEDWSTETLATEAALVDKDFVFEPELFAEPEAPVAEVETPAPVVTAQAEPIVDEAFHDATDRDFVVTKLELARQYLEMSDAESARDLLQEVLEEGDEELKQAATDLLKKIS